MPRQTCWFDHLYKTTTHLRQPMLSPPKPIHMQSLLYKTTIFLTWPVTTFLSPKWKKNLSKTTTVKFYSMQKWEGMQKKRMSLWLYLLYCYSNAKFIVFLSMWWRHWILNARSGAQIFWVSSISRLFQSFNLLKLIKWVPGTPGNLVV